jgi:biopolymer transport protein ExbB
MRPGAQIFHRWLLPTLLLLLANGCNYDLDRTWDSAPPDSAPPDSAPPDSAPPDGPTAKEAAPPDGPPCQTWNQAWTKRSKLTFNNQALGGAASDVLIDFPVLITLTPKRHQALSLRQDGADLRFVDADGQTELPYEVETWTPAGTCHVWVRVPQIDKSSTTDHIWLHHGNPKAGPSSLLAATVWSKGFSGVWHLNQDPAATAPQFPDSTVNANDATAKGTPGKSQQAAGQIGGAIYFPGQTSCRLEALNSPSLSPTTSLTLESWVKPHVINTDYGRHPVTKPLSYFLQIARTYTTSPAIYIQLQNYTWYAASVPKLTVNTWAYLVGTYDTTERVLRIYLNGQLTTSNNLVNHKDDPVKTTPPIKSSTNPLQIGTAIQGEVDEVRLAAVKRSDGWIAAQHRSMTDVFVTYGPAEATCP